MSLIGALNIGKQALTVHQAAIQTTGNNISNAGNADYTRQVTDLSATRDQRIGATLFAGTGVQIDGIRRQIDDALEGRLRVALSDSESAQVNQQWLGQVESVLNELGDSDLSTRLSEFFGSWSNLANKPQDIGLRQVVIQNGQTVASWLADARGSLTDLQTTIDQRMPALVEQADKLSQQIADLNRTIAVTEAGNGIANNLRDQRGAAVKQLSSLLDVKTVEQPNGGVNVYVGSEPLVIGTDTRGLTLVKAGTADKPVPEVRFKANLGTVSLKSGQIGGLQEARSAVDAAAADLDAIAGSLIHDLNKVHAAGQGLEGFDKVTASNVVEDPTVALNDPKSGLAQPPANGSFVVHVKEKATGLVTSTLVQVDLDGVGPGTTLNDLRASLDGVAGVNAAISGGRFTVSADSAAVELSFSQDSSGVLASLGVNTFFTGKDASDIAVSQALQDNPQRLAAAKNGQKGDNQTARLIAALETQPVAAFGGQSLKERYEGAVSRIATSADAAKTNADAAQGVLETLQAQRESLSGVSLDEEAVNLMREQRAFQGAARLITAVNEMMDVVLNMAR
ncbi:MAG: Flagellar hook-associated protein FlgK [uncultured Phycisphaerae bacterium]|uniref:Flagellar hook-associated protein 1 n=1 Tax=uncultured Phycisphaerae bacterium TaxID=904963 RepID=A0A6J4MZS6_9BACT|nr:MAG: Flagellar hook-associated protein FlgK [uncultured Phycisphaerae bacterium]